MVTLTIVISKYKLKKKTILDAVKKLGINIPTFAI